MVICLWEFLLRKKFVKWTVNRFKFCAGTQIEMSLRESLMQSRISSISLWQIRRTFFCCLSRVVIAYSPLWRPLLRSKCSFLFGAIGAQFLCNVRTYFREQMIFLTWSKKLTLMQASQKMIRPEYRCTVRLLMQEMISRSS